MPNLDLTLLHAPSVYDFRRESILYGPVSDLVPSTPVFEMYPIGFTTIAEYLERNGMKCRICNLAFRMLENPKYDVEKSIQKMDSAAFGVDLHWLPHAHGSIEIARIVKRLHPDRPIIFGGFSSTYYYTELIHYPAVDFVMRGDSTEKPMLDWVRYVHSGGIVHPSVHSPDALELEKIPNLVWKDSDLTIHVNPLTYSPDTLDDLMMDYSGVVKSVVRYRDLASYIPFKNWLNYPITAAITSHGCSYNCVTCGGSACAFRNMHGRNRPVYRSPENLASDIRSIGRFSRGPVMVIGDIRQGGDVYADRFLNAIQGYNKPIYFEFFDAPPRDFLKRLSEAIPEFTIEISMESHDERIRKAFGRPYTNAAIEKSIEDALEFGCQRLDLFFMVGIKEQTYESVMETVDYSRTMLEKYARQGEHRVIPFISPMAPFLDPGSRAFEEPEKHGFRKFAQTLEEHRKLLLAPSWKYVLNYETQWMDRNTIVNATYEAGRRLNLIKGECGVIPAEKAETTDQRIRQAINLMTQIDEIMKISELSDRKAVLNEFKRRVDDSNQSTVCDKRELETPMKGLRIDFVRAAEMVVQDWGKEVGRAFHKPGLPHDKI